MGSGRNLTQGVFGNLYNWIIAFLITDSVVINIMAANGFGENAIILSKTFLYLSTILSCFVILVSKKKWTPLFYVLLVLAFMAYYQTAVVHTSEREIFVNFFIRAVGGLFIGYSISNYDSLLKKVGLFSLIYCLILFTEPLNHALMGLGNMSTGYNMVPLVIWLIAVFFRNKSFLCLFVAIPIALMIILFSSRGCGLSIIAAIIAFKLYSNHQKGVSLRKSITSFILILIAGYFIFLISAQFVVNHHMIASDDNSSFISRLVYGGAYESSDRDIVWATALGLITQNYTFGLGMGNDRIFLSSFQEFPYVHNIILEVLLNFGIFVGLGLMFLYSKTIVKYFKNCTDIGYHYVVMALFCMHIIRLFFSGTYLENSFEVFFLLGVSMSFPLSIRKTIRKKKRLVVNKSISKYYQNGE